MIFPAQNDAKLEEFSVVDLVDQTKLSIDIVLLYTAELRDIGLRLILLCMGLTGKFQILRALFSQHCTFLSNSLGVYCRRWLVAYPLWRGNIPYKVQLVYTMAHCGSSRLVNHAKYYCIIVLSSDVKLDCFMECGIYHIWFGYYLGWEVVYKSNIDLKWKPESKCTHLYQARAVLFKA